MRVSHLPVIAILCGLLGPLIPARADTFTAIQDGNWNDFATWGQSPPDPISGANVVNMNGKTVTYGAGSIIAAGIQGAGTLYITSSAVLIGDDLSFTGTFGVGIGGDLQIASPTGFPGSSIALDGGNAYVGAQTQLHDLTGSGKVTCYIPDGSLHITHLLAPGGDSANFGTITANNTAVADATGVALTLDSTAKMQFKVGANGKADRVDLENTTFDITSGALDLIGLAGAWDGRPYAIATFGGLSGEFNKEKITGLPSNYQINYDENNGQITLTSSVPLPKPVFLGTALFATLAVLQLLRKKLLPV